MTSYSEYYSNEVADDSTCPHCHNGTTRNNHSHSHNSSDKTLAEYYVSTCPCSRGASAGNKMRCFCGKSSHHWPMHQVNDVINDYMHPGGTNREGQAQHHHHYHHHVHDADGNPESFRRSKTMFEQSAERVYMPASYIDQQQQQYFDSEGTGRWDMHPPPMDDSQYQWQRMQQQYQLQMQQLQQQQNNQRYIQSASAMFRDATMPQFQSLNDVPVYNPTGVRSFSADYARSRRGMMSHHATLSAFADESSANEVNSSLVDEIKEANEKYAQSMNKLLDASHAKKGKKRSRANKNEFFSWQE